MGHGHSGSRHPGWRACIAALVASLRDGVLCCHILKVFYALAVREVPDRYILPRWSVEPVVDSGVEVAANEPLQEAQITDHGKHGIRKSRM